ncbi:type I restriction endonuclease [Moheibacter sediminis]|uniref:Type I restriction enzyme R protein N-terminal domain-containing protein n=1 Tax=Moheibacter sediminis TaxID=1434700 RepID=A0A1W2C1P4_9FLAO|nr:type I restriction endonuclease [Moheibacter sediminis]SMC79093.1 hypothetical protein SAMN06296427_10865 [Moheibacter sediminis]
MEFKDQIKMLGDRIEKLKSQVLTEEATKNAFIMPFIKELGYDVFNPLEVVPELIADIGIKKGEKIDYAIMKDGQPVILIECKCHIDSLDVNKESQLFRYFHTTKAKFAILTNGIVFKFYTDLDTPNRMDMKSFFSFDITNIKPFQIEELKKFHKSIFDVDNITNTANELKYTNELKKIIHSELTEPSDDFIRYLAKQVYTGQVNAKIIELFRNLIKASFQQYLSDNITDRLKNALTKEQDIESEQAEIISHPTLKDSDIVTTEEELEGFYIVKAILRNKVEGARIHYRDAQSYFAILLDDNNRKSICRLYLNGGKKYLAVIDESKKEIKHEIFSLDDIYNHSEDLEKSLLNYIEQN